MNEFNEYVRDRFSEFGDIVIKSMMGGYLKFEDANLIGELLRGMYAELPEKKPAKAR